MRTGKPKVNINMPENVLNQCREDAPDKSCIMCMCTEEECIESQHEAKICVEDAKEKKEEIK